MSGPRQHQKVRFDSRTGYKGVGWHTTAGAWRAAITAPDGRRLHLGLHSTPEAAAHAYDQAALELYGPGAWTNADHVAGLTLDPDGVRDASTTDERTTP